MDDHGIFIGAFQLRSSSTFGYVINSGPSLERFVFLDANFPLKAIQYDATRHLCAVHSFLRPASMAYVCVCVRAGWHGASVSVS